MESAKRLEILISKLGLTKREFAFRIGKLPQNINTYIKGGRSIGKNFASDVKEKFPIVNTDWLLYGNGEMFIPDHVDYSKKELINEINYLKNELEILKEKYEQSINFIKDLQNEANEFTKNR
ncbi:MAG: hypothetical protein KDC73_11640 [Ignavibacteriae bacterium]|nr:hypothetical protein [Ignavibacteriota bacterium]MCB9243506.1 hypothetical protein [Ignavibacteriales bacterium]